MINLKSNKFEIHLLFIGLLEQVYHNEDIDISIKLKVGDELETKFFYSITDCIKDSINEKL